jgi:hypothetical protein
VTSTAATRCTLDGVPALTSAGRAVPTGPGEVPGGAATPATIDPGEIAFAQLTTAGGCPGQAVTHRDLAIGPGIRIPGLTLESTCPVGVSPWYRAVPEETPGPGRFAPLLATVDAPATVDRGRDVVYVVTLRNPGGQPVSLQPCPVYLQRLGKYGGWFTLNCAVATIAAGSAVRFAMRLTVPVDAESGRALLHWALDDGISEAAVADVPVIVG